MIGKLLNLPYSKIGKTVHGETEQKKRRSSQNQSEQDEKEEAMNVSGEVPEAELLAWIKELNGLDCYVKNNLKFALEFESRSCVISLVDKNGHTVQEYLPVQFKALYFQLKKDKADSKKGTILNLNC